MERERGVVRGVIRREDHRPLSRRHAEAFDVPGGRTGEHHAGTVAVGERDGPLVGAGSEHDVPRSHVPNAFAWLAACRVRGRVRPLM